MDCISFQVINNVKFVILCVNGIRHTMRAKYFLSHDLQHLLHKVGFSLEEEALIRVVSPNWPPKGQRDAEQYYCTAYPQYDCSSFTELCNSEDELNVPDSGILFHFVGTTLQRVYM